MIKAQNREALRALAGVKPAAPLPEPPPPAPAPMAAPPGAMPQIEQALLALSGHVRDVATLASQLGAVAAALADKPRAVLEGEIVRDMHGKMTRIIITIQKEKA